MHVISLLILLSVSLGMLKEFTLEEKIAQLLMFSLKEQYITETSSIVSILKTYKLGGLILFANNIVNPTQLLALNTALQKYSPTPLFISVDEEGGYVARLSPKNGFPDTYSAFALEQFHDYSKTQEAAANIGKTLAEMKINMNFAPDTDLLVNPNNPIIAKYNRSFSADPIEDTKQARAFIQGLHQYKIFTSIKHFPGHGSSTSDSHEGFVDVTDTWQSYELDPFRNLVNDTDMVMIAHIFNKNLDPLYPASLSKATVTGILREQLKFNGIIITDSLTMGAISKNYAYEDAIILALNAGNDILLICTDDVTYPKKTLDILVNAVKTGKVPLSRVEESFQRIMNVKNTKFPKQ